MHICELFFRWYYAGNWYYLYQVTDTEVPLAFQGLVLADLYVCLLAFAPVHTLSIYIHLDQQKDFPNFNPRFHKR